MERNFVLISCNTRLLKINCQGQLVSDFLLNELISVKAMSHDSRCDINMLNWRACHMKSTHHTSQYSRVSHIRNHLLSVRSEPVSYRMRLVSRECSSSFLFEELSSVLGLN